MAKQKKKVKPVVEKIYYETITFIDPTTNKTKTRKIKVVRYEAKNIDCNTDEETKDHMIDDINNKVSAKRVFNDD